MLNKRHLMILQSILGSSASTSRAWAWVLELVKGWYDGTIAKVSIMERG